MTLLTPDVATSLQQALQHNRPAVGQASTSSHHHVLQAMVANSQAAYQCWQAQQDVGTQTHLEDVLLLVLTAMERFGLDANRGLIRALERTKATNEASAMGAGGEQRVFVLYPDWVDIRVGNEIRGGWPLHSPDDVAAARQLADDLGCLCETPQGQQLALF
jgi:hypothetical protein